MTTDKKALLCKLYQLHTVKISLFYKTSQENKEIPLLTVHLRETGTYHLFIIYRTWEPVIALLVLSYLVPQEETQHINEHLHFRKGERAEVPMSGPAAKKCASW